MKSAAKLFPYPLLIGGAGTDGLLIPWAQECTKSIAEMMAYKSSGICMMASCGFDYIRIDADTVCTGVFVREAAHSSPARSKLLRKYHHRSVSRPELDRVIHAFRANEGVVAEELDRAKEELLRKYIRDSQYKADFLRQIKPEIEKGLSFLHDYKQINAQIAQNINHIIESKYSGGDFDAKLDRATDQEKAIYFGSKMLADKMLVSRFLLNQDWIDKRDACRTFRFHGLATKYLKIYESNFMHKGIRLQRSGTSTNEIHANPDAIAVVVHTFIDNAIKYAPRGSTAEMEIQDRGTDVLFAVRSFGPVINEDELQRIFEPFYRGVNARKQEEEGAGYGLYVSQLIASRHLGRLIGVKQDRTRTTGRCVWTEFSIAIPERSELFS